MTSGHDRTPPGVVYTRLNAPLPHPTEPGQVLVVDDDPQIRELVSNVLTGAGYVVATADNGASALPLLCHLEHSLDLILLDQDMPVMNGDRFVQELRRRNSSVPIVAFTGMVDGEHWAAQIQAIAFLAKPFVVDDLLTTVARFCRAKRSHQLARPQTRTSKSPRRQNGPIAC